MVMVMVMLKSAQRADHGVYTHPPTGDRQRPQCGTCADAGIVCEINNNRLARGPKKGDLKALRSRIGKH